jgi:hypothetical protein
MRNSKLWQATVAVRLTADPISALDLLPTRLRSAVDAAVVGTNSTGLPIRRTYDYKAKEIYSRIEGGLPSPMRANAIMRGGRMVVDAQGTKELAGIFRRNSSEYLGQLLLPLLEELRPYVPGN